MKYKYLYAGIGAWLVSAALALPATAQTTRLDPTFQPPQVLQTTATGSTVGTVNAVVRQPDGKYVIGGSFNSINGVRTRNLARLNANGTLDLALMANRPVYSLALQADGSILAAGQFDSLAGAPRRAVGRLLPTGAIDAAFDVGLSTQTLVSQVAVMPGGDVLTLSPSGPYYNVQPTGLRRLSGATGLPVAGFQPAVDALCMTVLPDGKILTGGGGGSYILMHMLARLLPNGSLDPSFPARTNYATASTVFVGAAANGDAYMASSWNGGQLTRTELVGPQGSLGTGGLGNVSSFEFQPNGRILLAGTPANNTALTSRLLANGQADASYAATNGPLADAAGQGQVKRLLTQSDGAIVMAGSFSLAGTTPVWGLVRMLDANVLAVKDNQMENASLAWPIPANETVNVKIETAARPQQVQLLDGLGRAALTKPVAASTSTVVLDVATVPAGVYTLRVSYGQGGPVVRRIAVQH